MTAATIICNIYGHVCTFRFRVCGLFTCLLSVLCFHLWSVCVFLPTCFHVGVMATHSPTPTHACHVPTHPYDQSSQLITEHNLLTLFHQLFTGDSFKSTPPNVCLPVVVEEEDGKEEEERKKEEKGREEEEVEEGEGEERKQTLEKGPLKPQGPLFNGWLCVCVWICKGVCAHRDLGTPEMQRYYLPFVRVMSDFLHVSKFDS